MRSTFRLCLIVQVIGDVGGNAVASQKMLLMTPEKQRSMRTLNREDDVGFLQLERVRGAAAPV